MTRKLIRLFVWAAVFAVVIALLHQGMVVFLKAVYPLDYREEVVAAAEKYDLSPSLLLAVIHTESGFDPEARSSAGAIGLMQVTEPTMQWAMMRTGGDTSLTGAALTDPTFNIDTGSCVLALLKESFVKEDTVLAAYNAGSGRVQQWLSDAQYSADGITLQDIPYKETKNYVKKVRQAQRLYQTLYDLA